MKKNIPTLGPWITALREAQESDWSQAKFGRRLGGITPQSVNRYEKNRALPSLDVLWRLLKVACESSQTHRLAGEFARAIGEHSGISAVGVLLAALITLEGPDALRHISRLAKRALEILEE